MSAPGIVLREGLDAVLRFYVLVHELGHAFGLGDTYVGRREDEPSVSKGGLGYIIGTQPASVMAMHMLIVVTGTYLSEDDENGMVWLYKVVHEGWVDEDCLYPNYQFERSPDGCVMML